MNCKSNNEITRRKFVKTTGADDAVSMNFLPCI